MIISSASIACVEKVKIYNKKKTFQFSLCAFYLVARDLINWRTLFIIQCVPDLSLPSGKKFLTFWDILYFQNSGPGVNENYTFSHPKNDRDVTDRAQWYTLQGVSFMRQSKCSFLKVWENTSCARDADNAVFLQNTYMLTSMSFSRWDKVYVLCSGLFFYTITLKWKAHVYGVGNVLK